MISFASNAGSNGTLPDVAMATNNIGNITRKVATMNFTGATFGPGGLTLAKTQEDNTNPSGNVVKLIVYFTDGHANTIQDSFNCNGVPTLYNYGGHDTGSSVDFFDPSSGNFLATYQPGLGWSPSTFCLNYVTQFYSQGDGRFEVLNRAHVTADARYRALQTANAMLSEAAGITIYSIGLGSDIDQAFLQQIANDPSSPTYNPALPQGLAVFTPSCPGPTCTQQLNEVFQVIASKILLRLTQ